MLEQPPDEYKGKFPPDDPRLPELTAAHESFLNSLGRYASHKQTQQSAMEAFDRRNAGLVDLHRQRLGILNDGNVMPGAPMAMEWYDAEEGDEDEPQLESRNPFYRGRHHRTPQPYGWNQTDGPWPDPNPPEETHAIEDWSHREAGVGGGPPGVDAGTDPHIATAGAGVQTVPWKPPTPDPEIRYVDREKVVYRDRWHDSPPDDNPPDDQPPPPPKPPLGPRIRRGFRIGSNIGGHIGSALGNIGGAGLVIGATAGGMVWNGTHWVLRSAWNMMANRYGGQPIEDDEPAGVPDPEPVHVPHPKAKSQPKSASRQGEKAPLSGSHEAVGPSKSYSGPKFNINDWQGTVEVSDDEEPAGGGHAVGSGASHEEIQAAGQGVGGAVPAPAPKRGFRQIAKKDQELARQSYDPNLGRGRRRG